MTNSPLEGAHGHGGRDREGAVILATECRPRGFMEKNMTTTAQQPSLPSVEVTPANRIKLERRNGAWAATRYALPRDLSIAVKRKYHKTEDGQVTVPKYAIYHLHTLNHAQLDGFLAFLDEQGIKYEAL